MRIALKLFRQMARLIVVGVVASTLAAAATPPPAPPMSFVVVRNDSYECDPDCPEWIAAQGEIRAGTAQIFEAFLAKLDARRRPVIIDSNGGSVEDALEIGRLIRARRLAVAVGRTTIFEPPAAYKLFTASPQAPKSGHVYSYPAFCLSACAFVLAAGVERYASPLAIVGVHEVKQRQSRTLVKRRYIIRFRIVNGRKREISRQLVSEQKNTYASTNISPPAVNARLVAYFKEMGDDPKLVALMQTATPDQIHLVTPDEEKDTRLVTMWIDQSSAVVVKPPENGLAGAPADPASGARAALEADDAWTVASAQDGGARAFAAHLVLRRGGAGVAATYTSGP
jgi:hypothetical protein